MIIKRAILLSKSPIQTLVCRGQHTVQLKELRLKSYGNEIETCLELHKSDLNVKLEKSQVLVKLVNAPINPADLNIIQGKYGVLPASLPAPLGNEGLFEVCAVNADSSFSVGDFVLPNKLLFATWRSHVVELEENFIKLPNNLDKLTCATLSVNPMTALRMLQDFKKLSVGDTIIQNGANSGVGQAVIQLGKIFGLNVVNVVRKRERQSELTEYLESIGGTYIYTEDMLRRPELTRDLWQQIPKPKLALNCVGGKATTDMVRLLDQNAVMVTYGGMSRQPLTFNTADFIFKDLKACGFWLTRWRQENPSGYVRSIRELCGFIAENKFKGPKCEVFDLEQYEEAFKFNSTPFLNSKVLFRS